MIVNEEKEERAMYGAEIPRLETSDGTPDNKLVDALDAAIKALDEKEQIENLLKCHNDFSVETAQTNYEIVKAIRVILGIDERP